MAWVVKRAKLNSKKCVLWDTLLRSAYYEEKEDVAAKIRAHRRLLHYNGNLVQHQTPQGD